MWNVVNGAGRIVGGPYVDMYLAYEAADSWNDLWNTDDYRIREVKAD